jgi:hypothetical protein
MESFLREFPEDLQTEIVSILEQSAGVQYIDGADYASARSAKNAEAINAKTAASQEIGPLPDIQDPQRRERASADNLLFAETYFPKTFYLPWAPYQKEMMDRFQESILGGGKECHAVRRGGLKSTCARVSALWAALNGHSRFPVLVGATDKKAKEHRKNLFDMMASSTTLLDDYPELTPMLLKLRQPKRQFRLDGRMLTLHPKDDMGRIVFADIPGVPSCQTHIAPFSIDATDISGLAYVDRDGVTIRPDAIIYDDVQTPQSAKSPIQTDQREERITKTIAGLKGVGQKMAEIMVCTVRNHDCLTMRFVSRKRHPDWNGKLHKSVLRMPDKMDMWEIYKAKLSQGATPAEGKALALQYYEHNRAAMDAGGEVAWEYDKDEGDISALQSLMTIWATDAEFFRCEIQQEGAVPVNTSGLRLDSQTLLSRLSLIERGKIPDNSSYTTAYIDSSDQVLWWMVTAFSPDLTGWVVDYGTWPDQGRPVFYKSDLARRISQMLPGSSWEEAFVHAHNQLELELLTRFPDLDLILKDWSDGGQMPLIRGQIQASANKNRMRPAKGFAPKPGRKPIHLWGDARDKAGTGWIERRGDALPHVQFDANIIKSNAARRLLTVVGAPSAITLPGFDETAHKLLAEHFTSEQPKELIYDGSPGVRWELMPGRDNDLWDCFVGTITAASVLGCRLNGDTPAKKQLRTFAIPGGARG